MAERRITIALPDSLVEAIEGVIAEGDAATLDAFIASALRHELDRRRADATHEFFVPEEAPPEEIGIGWEGLVLKGDESPRVPYESKPMDEEEPR